MEGKNMPHFKTPSYNTGRGEGTRGMGGGNRWERGQERW